MKITILTLFPEMFSTLTHSILGKAQERGLIEIRVVNIRDFSKDKNKRCDDYSYGGGAGMIMTPQPIFDAINSVCTDNSHVIYLSPKGTTLNQNKVISLAQNYQDIVLVCGHYEGIDERVIDLCVDEEISIGDYVLTGGEYPAMVLVDAIARYVPNVLGNENATEDESFSTFLLEYPQYTRPEIFMNREVPEVLLSGNHKEIAKWRENKAIEITKKRRKDLYKKYIKDLSGKKN